MVTKNQQIDFAFLEELVQSNQLAVAMNECLWVGDHDHKTIYVNPAFEKLSGYNLEECIGRDCSYFFDEDGKKTIDKHHNLRKTGQSSQYEASMITKDGRKVPLWISGAPSKDGGTIGVFTNLENLRALEKNQRIVQQILQHSTEAIAILDQDRKITLWSSGATKVFGYKEEEMMGNSIDVLIPDNALVSYKELAKEVEKKGYLKNVEAQRLAKNGDLVDVSISVTKVLDRHKEFTGYLVIYHDITQEKQTTKELQNRFEAIQDAYKELGLQRRQLDYLYDILDSSIGTDSTLEQLEKLIVSALTLLTKADGTILRLVEGDYLKLKSCIGVDQKWCDKHHIKVANSLAWEAFEHKRPLIINNVFNHSRHQGIRLVRMHKFTTAIIVPLFIHGQFLGSLSLYATDPSKFRLIETDFLEKMGKQCSLAIYAKQVASLQD